MHDKKDKRLIWIIQNAIRIEQCVYKVLLHMINVRIVGELWVMEMSDIPPVIPVLEHHGCEHLD